MSDVSYRPRDEPDSGSIHDVATLLYGGGLCNPHRFDSSSSVMTLPVPYLEAYLTTELGGAKTYKNHDGRGDSLEKYVTRHCPCLTGRSPSLTVKTSRICGLAGPPLSGRHRETAFCLSNSAYLLNFPMKVRNMAEIRNRI